MEGAQYKAPDHSMRIDPSAQGNHQGMEWYDETGPSWASLHGENLGIHMDLPGTDI